MGILSDTILDARRPLPNGRASWLRRMVQEEPPRDVPDEALPSQPDESGMHTVFRFQKEGPPSMTGMPREASLRSGVSKNDLPTDGPLSVESEVEKPDLSANDVNGNEDIFSVLGDNRGNELATGQINHGSPRRNTAVKVSPDSRTHQSVVMPEPIASVSAHQRHQSVDQQGSARFVSEREETYQSWVAGQGAPSDPFTAPITPLRSALPGPTSTGRPDVPGHSLWPDEAAPGQAVMQQGGASGERIIPDATSLDHGSVPLVHVPMTAAISMESPFDQGDGSAAMVERPESGSNISSTPQLVIGRIDVVVVTKETTSGTKTTLSTRSDSGFVSRNYLKRL